MFKITVIACGNKMPSWVETGVSDYSKRLHEFVQLSFIEIPLIKRSTSSNIARIMEKESELMCKSIPKRAHVIALEIAGQPLNSVKLAKRMEAISTEFSHLCFLIGGPEGLSSQTLAHSQEQWSLSALTFPHPLVRIMLMEALYRGFAILNNHPYHK